MFLLASNLKLVSHSFHKGSVLSPFLFCLAFSVIWAYYPPPIFPSRIPMVARISSIWIIAYADDLAVICGSTIRLSRCLTRLSNVLKKFWLAISVAKTEVVSFTVRPSLRRPQLPVRVGDFVLPRSHLFKYLGVMITASGSLCLHQKAVAAKARVAAREVSGLFRSLGIRNLTRLRTYLQSFVDGQFYALELLPLPTALDIERARKTFLCETFNLPSCTAKNLVYAIFPVAPAVFLLAKRRQAFLCRAQEHDLDQVKEAFLFDMAVLYPSQYSWTAQSIVILNEIGVDVDLRSTNLITCFERATEVMQDVELLCFRHIAASEERTLSFFRLFPTVEVASDFRSFLSTQPDAVQDFLLLFLSSGLRWRFFEQSSRGTRCPLCRQDFWSWEHFFLCPRQSRRDRHYSGFLTRVASCDWRGLALDCCHCVTRWEKKTRRKRPRS